MLLDHALILKVSLFNTVALAISIGMPWFLDPLLTSHVQYKSRHYPKAPWLLALCPVVFACTYFSLSETEAHTRNAIFSFLFLALIGGAAAFLFPPERPHMGVLTNTFVYSLLSFLTVWLRHSRDPLLYLVDSSLDFDGRLERLKATISTWQLITVYAAAGYLAFVIFLVSVLWSVSQLMLTKPSERFLFGNVCLIGVCCYSVFVIIGPLHEAFDMVLRATEQLSAIRR